MKRRSAIKTISLGMGYTLSATGMATFISGCKQDGSITDTVSEWSPIFLSTDQRLMVESILDAMLPRTEMSPGYKEVNAIQILDNTVAKIYDAEDRSLFGRGLEYLLPRFDRSGGIEAFMDRYMTPGPEEEQGRIDRILDTPIADLKEEDQEDYLLYTTLGTIRSLGISSYFNCEIIGTEHLGYDPVPGVWNGCVDIESVGDRVWAAL